MPICPECRVAYLDSETHVCEPASPSSILLKTILLTVFLWLVGLIGLDQYTDAYARGYEDGLQFALNYILIGIGALIVVFIWHAVRSAATTARRGD